MNKTIKAILITLTVLLIAFIVVISLPITHRPRRKALLSMCENNLRMIDKALNAYSNDNDGVFPHLKDDAGLFLLLKKGYLENKKYLYCPVPEDDKSEISVSYHYMPGFSYSKNKHDIAICWDRESNHPEIINVLFSDGSIKRFRNPKWKSKMQQYLETSVSNPIKSEKTTFYPKRNN